MESPGRYGRADETGDQGVRRVLRADSGGFQTRYALVLLAVVAVVAFGLPGKVESLYDSATCAVRTDVTCGTDEAMGDGETPWGVAEQDPFAPDGHEETWSEAFDRILKGVDEVAEQAD
jgi:hypothetical protein